MTDWRDDAACKGMDQAIFFPTSERWAERGRAICAICPVRPQCEQAGRSEDHGLWGGKLRDNETYRIGYKPVDRGTRRCYVCGGEFVPTGPGIGTTRCSHECEREWQRLKSRNATRQRRISSELIGAKP